MYALAAAIMVLTPPLAFLSYAPLILKRSEPLQSLRPVYLFILRLTLVSIPSVAALGAIYMYFGVMLGYGREAVFGVSVIYTNAMSIYAGLALEDVFKDRHIRTPPILAGYLTCVAFLFMLVFGAPLLVGVGIAFVSWHVICAAGMWRWARRARIVNRTVRGACPKCGYSMRGIAESTCPECGSEWAKSLGAAR